MSSTNFKRDDANRKMIIDRTFDAPADLVWKAWTDSTILDQWWAPKPYKTVTKHMDFSPGGHWFYSMNGPEGDQHWCRADYERIDPKTSYEAQDCFCQKDGSKIDSMPSTHWHVHFRPKGNSTEVVVTTTYPSVEAMDRIIEMGFKEGFAAAQDNLEALIAEGGL